MRITIPFKTPSVDNLYWHRGNIKIMKSKAKELRETILELVPKCELKKNARLRVETQIYENWFYKNGEVAKKDVSNREKFLVDSVFKALGIDDRYIFVQLLVKVQSDEEKAVMEITEL